jgi:hypothetical protein
MITDPERTTLLSSMGWVDGDALWRFDVASGRIDTIPVASGARYLSLHESGSDRFVAAHHFDGARFELTVRRFAEPRDVIARAEVVDGESRLHGDADAWRDVPRLYVGYLEAAPWKDYVLMRVLAPAGRVEIQPLEWFDDHTYDKGYQGVIQALAVSDDTALVSVQRSSRLILHDLNTGKRTRSIDLAERGGNPLLTLRNSGRELWASDYDTIVVVDPIAWRVVRSMRLQDATTNNMRQFIGDYAFAADEPQCVVARPFSGDVVAIDANSLRTRRSAWLGHQPLEVAPLPRGRIVARDWKTGAVLTGTLKRKWL